MNRAEYHDVRPVVNKLVKKSGVFSELYKMVSFSQNSPFHAKITLTLSSI